MKSKAPSNPLTTQVTAAVLVLAAFALAIVIGFGFFATIRADTDSLEKQKAFVATGVADQMESIVRQQQSVTVWDDSVIAARDGDQQWMTENLGAWLYDYYGHDRVYVLDAEDAPVHAMREGKTLDPSIYADDRDVLSPVVGTMRRQLKSAGTNGTDRPVVKDVISLDGRPAFVAIQPLVASSDRVVVEPGTEYLHVDIRFIDQGAVDRIASKFLLSGAHLVPQLAARLDAASVPLIDSHGVILGYIAWNQDRPGLTLVKEAAPALIVCLLLAGGTLTFLLRRLRRASAQLQMSQHQAQYLALHDTLTGLPNRTLFDDRLRRALATAYREHRRIALLYLDLDRFKHVNDTLGHPVGDELVRQTARRLQHSVRDVDTVARLGGDEFAVIVVSVRDGTVAEDLCRRLLDQIGQPFDLMGNQVFVGASIGVALSNELATDPADLLRRADIALYEAKRKGRGRYELFAGDMDEILLRKRMIETDLRAALAEDGQLRLVYQPVYGNDGTDIAGAEALVRWRHPVNGEMLPGQFIRIAEERGIICQLGRWAIAEAIRFAVHNNLPWVAVNVSPMQLREEGFPLSVMAALTENGLQPSRLQLEITESTLLDSNDTTSSALLELRASGIRIALDDFGTGYSSLSYLARHGIDKLKIDRSFVRQLGVSDAGNAIVKALVDLAVGLQVKVTAEGVETPVQRDLLVAMGCHELQGFLLSEPLEAADFKSMLTGTPVTGTTPTDTPQQAPQLAPTVGRRRR